MTTPQPYSARDFARVPGTQRRYVNLVTGAEVSRRQHQVLIGQPLPKTVSDRPTLYVKLVRQEAALSSRRRRQVQQDINFKANWHHLRELWQAEARGGVIDHSPEYAQAHGMTPEEAKGTIDRSPTGDLARTMRALNMKHDTQWWVGETP